MCGTQAMMQQMAQQMGASNPALAQQLQAFASNPGMMDQAARAMSNPQAMQQALSMMRQQG